MDLLMSEQLMKPTLPLTLLSCVFSSLVVASSAHAEDDQASANEECLSCHQNEDMTLTLENGKEAPLYMKPELLSDSVHRKLRCVECHPENAEVPHPERKFKDLHEFRESFTNLCNKCHAENHVKMMDGVHGKLQGPAKENAPTCVSCHGTHSIQKPDVPRTRITQSCAPCHKDVMDQYAKSVHGQELVRGNPDVPSCTDCHRPHDMADTKDRAWLMNTPMICGKCHADAKLMKKYGLSTAVLSTYLSDFHGMTASFGAKGKKTPDEKVVALCTDCHGVHAIGKASKENAAALRANLVETCRKCHVGASTNFPSAWLGHYEPTLASAPFVFSVKLFYQLLIPFIISGLLLQILLHFRRSVAKR